MSHEPLVKLSLRHFTVEPTDVLYHYTSLSGLMGIVESRSLFATDVKFLNDMNEVQHVFKLIQDARYRDRDSNDDMRAVKDKLSPSQLGMKFFDFMEQVKHESTFYVSCLTEEGSLLSQWRGYCPSQKGVSVGFRASDLAQAAKQQRFDFGKCIYPNAKQQSEIADKLLRGIATELIEPTKGEFHRHFALQSLFRFALLMKSQRFSEEQEWRVVSEMPKKGDIPALEFREGKSMLIPFRRFKLPTNADGGLKLARVFVGPTTHVPEAVTSVMQYLFVKKSMPEDGVHYCDIPLRET